MASRCVLLEKDAESCIQNHLNQYKMALLSNGKSLKFTTTNGKESNNHTSSNDPNTNNDLFLSNLLNAIPHWDPVQTSNPVPVPPSTTFSNSILNDEFLFSHVLGAIGTQSTGHELGAVGVGQLTPSTSPQTNSSESSAHCGLTYTISCGHCNGQATSRCLECNDALCDDCVAIHHAHVLYRDHCVFPLSNLSPIGSTAGISIGSPNQGDPQCDIHGEILRYVCEFCKKIVCQECTLWDHKDHSCVSVNLYAEGAREKIQAVLESGKLGKKYIKASIDRAVTYSQSIEKETSDIVLRIRKSMRHFILAAEERERVLLEKVEKCRLQKTSTLSDQMAGLRAALAGLAQTSDMLTKAVDNASTTTNMELAKTLTLGENQMEQFAAMYKSLQPKEDCIAFFPPNFELLQEIRSQGDVLMVNQRLTNGTMPMAPPTCSSAMSRRPIIRSALPQPKPILAWDQMSVAPNMLSTSPKSNVSSIGMGGCSGSGIVTGNGNAGCGKTTPNIGQSIPGCLTHIVAKPIYEPSTSFAFDGHEDGQVSRPWGLCVDKDGNIVVADRRNNRVQVFFADGSFKLKFGSKGSGNGQFDLPAGISTDPQNRIVVVDKDNHRVQVFNAVGAFVLKFGSYGKDCGQFQYPWDVAVNSKSEMLVTDSRNHRIQLFNPDGHFISRFSFDGVNHSRSLKGLTTPRGVCFTPQGDIIVSDFENHRLLLIDSSLTKILAAKGHEGNGVQEFCRPSGICCDDEGRVIVADSKNQRVLIFSPVLEFLWAVEIRPSTYPLMSSNIDEKDRPSDVAILPDGRLVVMVETSPDARDTSNPQKTFVQIY